MTGKPKSGSLPVRQAGAWAVAWVLCLLLLSACGRAAGGGEVVVYTSVDQVYAEAVLEAFEEQSGIRVLAVYDVEATKTVGLAARLLAERDNPQADVFWSGEFVQTIMLKAEGVLEPLTVPEGAGLPEGYVDPQGYWAAFGGRGRAILVNTELVPAESAPRSVFDLLDEAYPADTLALANPLFGTTATQAAALYAQLGAEQGRAFYQQVADRGVQVLDGNSVVRDRVAAGHLAWGLTDTDDACGAVERGAPVEIIIPDQGEGEIGTLIIPNTVARIKGGPHPEAGQALVDYLLSPEAEALMVELGWIQLPTRPLPAGRAPACLAGVEARGMSVGFEAIYGSLADASADMQAIFVR